MLVAFADRLVDGDKAEHPGSMSHAVLGDLLTLAAAALYAVYTVLLKVMMPEDCESDMMAFFGYLGAVNAVAFAPVLLIMQLAGSFNIFAIGRATLSVALLKGIHYILCPLRASFLLLGRQFISPEGLGWDCSAACSCACLRRVWLPTALVSCGFLDLILLL